MALNSPYRQTQLRQLLQKLGLPPHLSVDWELLDLALTHPSFSAEANYERLEFLGDAVLKLAAAQFLYQNWPQASEGEMSALRDVLVSDRALADIGDRYGLERYLLMGNATAKDSIGREGRVANAFEAVLAVLYLADPTLGLIRPWFEEHLHSLVVAVRQDPAQMNYKGALQELTQGLYHSLPLYRHREPTAQTGWVFSVDVWVQGACLGSGQGTSKKAAEQAAAQEAFFKLQQKTESERDRPSQAASTETPDQPTPPPTEDTQPPS